jgi:hypothetical protein
MLLLKGGWFRTRRPGVKFGVSFFFSVPLFLLLLSQGCEVLRSELQ